MLHINYISFFKMLGILLLLETKTSTVIEMQCSSYCENSLGAGLPKFEFQLHCNKQGESRHVLTF